MWPSKKTSTLTKKFHLAQILQPLPTSLHDHNSWVGKHAIWDDENGIFSSFEWKTYNPCSRDRPRFFDLVGHQTTNASIGNCNPVGVNQVIFLFHASIWRIFSKNIKKIAQFEIFRENDRCKMISSWGVMRKSDFRMGGHMEIRFLFTSATTISRFFENVWKFVNDRRLY